MGVVSVVKSKKIKLQIPEEEILTVMAHIRSILIKKYPDLNVSFIEMLTEEFFNSHFVEDAE